MSTLAAASGRSAAATVTRRRKRTSLWLDFEDKRGVRWFGRCLEEVGWKGRGKEMGEEKNVGLNGF